MRAFWGRRPAVAPVGKALRCSPTPQTDRFSKDPRGGAMLGIVLGSAFFIEDPAAPWADCTGSRTRRTLFDRLRAEVVVAEENAEREFVDSIRRTVSLIP